MTSFVWFAITLVLLLVAAIFSTFAESAVEKQKFALKIVAEVFLSATLASMVTASLAVALVFMPEDKVSSIFGGIIGLCVMTLLVSSISRIVRLVKIYKSY